LLDEKRSGSQALFELRSNPERFLATVQVGITLVGTAAAAFGGSSLAKYLTPVFEQIPWLAKNAEVVAFGSIVALISYLSLVFGELVPKSLALRLGERYALLMARPLVGLSVLTKPVVWALTASSNLVLRPFSDSTNFLEMKVSKEELLQMVDEAGESGVLDEHASELASRALSFDQLSLASVMVPRNRIDALSVDANVEQIRHAFMHKRRSHFPIYEGVLDNVIGYINAKDIMSMEWSGKPTRLRDLMRTIKIFPETVSAIEVLRYMQSHHQPIAIAVDDHGSISGLVTFEDLVEEIVGDFFSEAPKGALSIELQPDGTAIVRGDVPLREINRELNIELQGPDETGTVAGLCIHLAGGIPHRRARLAANDGIVIVVMDATSRSVKSVKIIPSPIVEDPLA
jgi:putative hemolysin